MPQQLQTVTNRLADVIEVVQLGRKTGLLTVERGEGASLEEGAITFVNGQPVQARVGKQSGQEALKVLRSWGPCRFAFVPFAPPTINGHATPGSLPALRRPQETDPALRRLQAGSRATLPLQPHSQLGPVWMGSPAGGASPSRAPVRVQPYEEALRLLEQRGFSRTHRRLFLLIDGMRSPAELARLMGRAEDEVWSLLSDLERAGFIVSP